MNNTDEMSRRLDVATYVDQVKACFADLAPEDREELVDGLEADLTERLMESSPGRPPEEVFGPPLAYADELRAAAGYPSTSGVRTGSGSRIRSAIERGRDRLEEFRSTSRGESVEQFLETLRPVWWVLRAWIALQTLDLAYGSYPHEWMISVHGYVNGFLVLLVASFVSIQIGRGVWWPGGGRTLGSRRLIFVLNAAAVVALVFVVADMGRNHAYGYVALHRSHPVRPPAQGLQFDGDPVLNVFAYDALGNPIVGVQLFDDQGNPLSVRPYAAQSRGERFAVDYPWPWTVRDDRTNVFPLPMNEQAQRQRVDNPFADGNALSISLPFATVPALSEETLAAIDAVTSPESKQKPPRQANGPGDRQNQRKPGQGG